jgi:hypothetical protein
MISVQGKAKKSRAAKLRQFFIRPLFLTPLALLFLGLIGWGIFHSSSRVLARYMRWQAERVVIQAEIDATEGRLQEARMGADTALRLHASQPRALRLVARLTSMEGLHAEARKFHERLSAIGGSTREDLEDYALSASRSGYFDEANDIANFVANTGAWDFPHLLKAEQLAAKGDRAGSVNALREAMYASDSSRSRMELARFLIANPNPAESLELNELLEKLAKDPSTTGAEALAMGLLKGHLPVVSDKNWIQMLRKHPGRTPSTDFVADYVEAANIPDSKPAVVAAMLERLKPAPVGDRLEPAKWLLVNGEPAAVLTLLPLADAMSSGQALQTWVDASAGVGQWAAIQEALSRPDVPLPPYLTKIYTARAIKMGGTGEDADVLLRAALQETKNNPPALVQVLGFLYRSGEQALFEEGISLMLANPEGAFPAMSQLVPALQSQGDAESLRRIFQKAAEEGALSGNPYVLNGLAYLDLVLGHPTDIDVLAKRLEESPKDIPYRFTFAFAQLQVGMTGKALLLVENFPVPVEQLHPSHQTVLACILAANGQKEKALALARQIPVQKVTTQELDLLRSRLRGGVSGATPP